MQMILDDYSDEIIQRAKRIKAFIFDVDGVFTNGAIIYDNEGNEWKHFSVKDGQIIKHLKSSGILVGVITGRESEVVKRRCKELKLDFHFHGIKNKLEIYEDLKIKFSLADEDISYIGDDINDLPLLSRVGLSATPNDSMTYVAKEVHLVSKKRGGKGVIREVADLVLAAQGKMEDIIKKYLN